VSIEGVSQALAYRDEFASIINRNGGHISALTDELRHKVIDDRGGCALGHAA
jgi:ABC-type transporter MlaC component